VAVSAPSPLLDARSRWIRWGLPLLGLLVAAVIAATARWGPDWPAQEFRAWSASHAGLTAWTNQWYSGVALPGYSVIYPAISGLLGAPLTGLAAVAVSAAGAARMAPTGERYREIGYRVSVGLVLAADLLIGQVPYLVGVAFGVWALWSLRARHPVAAAVLAAASSLSSPLSGAFLLLAMPAIASAYGWRRAVPFGTAVAGVAVSFLYGGASGPFPFIVRIFGYVTVFAVLTVVLTRRDDRAIRILGVTYGCAAIVLFAVPNPIGGNYARLGQLIALPLLWHVLPRLRWQRRAAVVPLIVLAALWPVYPSVTSAGRGASDPSQSPSYYDGMLAFLRTQDPTAGRLEVVFTREHWESLYVARTFPIARGWERQTDMGTNQVLYHSISAASYRQWLDDNGVALVALPNVPIDFGGKHEAALLQRPPSYLVPVWHDANWQVWRVQGAHGLVTGPATVRTLGTASVVLDFARPGTATVRIRADGMWDVTSGEGCVRSDSRGWLSVTSSASGPLTLRARMGVPATASGARCS
jgi:hypothetical protein